ncbi:hypothetical protein PISL3812_01618 [Talaromyces islandicus]|uniref:Uncharacterized protein n=1 Tax=Talaromyces islandicus TaxID=28573 RepID=A0A0U1LPS5_TALIS|nr:hypothetical protein PISL3812_01618 [Talaromyces islandicus]
MDELFNFHPGHTTQQYPYLQTWRNEIPRDLATTNETAPLNTYYQSPALASVRSPRFHDARELRARSKSRSQPRSSPTISDISPCSPPKRQKTLDSVSSATTTTSSFPLPYKPPSASHLTSSSEPPWTTVSLTSQDIHSYKQPVPLQPERGRALYGSGGDPWTVSATFRDAGVSESTLNAGHFPPQDQLNWQYSRAGRPGYGTRRAPLNPHHSPRSDPSSHSSMELSFSPENQNQPLLFDRKYGFSGAEAEPQRFNQPPLSNSPDYYDSMEFTAPSYGIPICGSRYHSAPGANDLTRHIRETPYWPGMKYDPVFRDLSEQGPTVPIEELINRRKLILKSHVLRPAMNEKGTQTDFKTPPPPSPAISTRSSDRDIGRSPDQPKTLETNPPTPEATFTHPSSRPSSRPTAPWKKPLFWGIRWPTTEQDEEP